MTPKYRLLECCHDNDVILFEHYNEELIRDLQEVFLKHNKGKTHRYQIVKIVTTYEFDEVKS